MDLSNMHKLRELRIYAWTNQALDDSSSAFAEIPEITRMLATLPETNSLELVTLDLKEILRQYKSVPLDLDRQFCDADKYGRCQIYVEMQVPRTGDIHEKSFTLSNVYYGICHPDYIRSLCQKKWPPGRALVTRPNLLIRSGSCADK
jgi:hypothetical protein